MRVGFQIQVAVVLALAMVAGAQTAEQPPAAYHPRFPGDPAHSDAEAAALGYVRTVIRAEREYKKKHNNQDYASSLSALVHYGSFTRRMANTERGDYTVSYRVKPRKDGYSLQLIPKTFDAVHRAFYADEEGTIRVENDKPATEDSARLK